MRVVPPPVPVLVVKDPVMTNVAKSKSGKRQKEDSVGISQPLWFYTIRSSMWSTHILFLPPPPHPVKMNNKGLLVFSVTPRYLEE